MIQHVPQRLRRRADDARAARGAGREEAAAERVAQRDDHGRDGAQWARAGRDAVVWRGRVVEGVGGGDGEVVHLVVQDHAGGGHEELRAEEQVDGRGEGEGEAGGVGGGEVCGDGQVVRVVGGRREGMGVGDLAADGGGEAGGEHTRLEGVEAGDEGRVAEGGVRGVGELERLVQSVRVQGMEGGVAHVVALDDLEDLERHGAAAGRRRRVHLGPAVVDRHGLADGHVVAGEVVEGHDAARALHGADRRLGYGAGVEGAGA